MKKTFVLMCFLMLFSLFVSCGKNDAVQEVFTAMTKEEAAGIIEPLIEKSYTINEIFFGKGLEADENLRDFYTSGPDNSVGENDYADYDVAPVEYLIVSQDCGYESCDDLKAAALEVYTEDFCVNSIFPVAFEGIKTEGGEIYEYARYIDNIDLFLAVRGDISEKAYDCSRRYDFDTLNISAQTADSVEFTLDSDDGITVNLMIVMEETGWRLDYPTY